MAITTLDGLIAGFKAPYAFYKLSGTTVAGRQYSPLLVAGYPGAATAPSIGVAGAALTTLAGQIPFTNPAGGSNSYLAQFNANMTNVGRVALIDRLWHNSGLSATSTSTQRVGAVISTASVANPTVITTVAAHNITDQVLVYVKCPTSTPAIDGYYTATVTGASTLTIPVNVTGAGSSGVVCVALPARDNDGAKDGAGIQMAVEVMSTLGAGTPTWTVEYTNQSGSITKSVTTSAITAAMVVGSFIPIQLAAGDTGVRAIESFKLSATMTSGTYSLVLYRNIASIDVFSASAGAMLDPISSGMPRLFDNTVPNLIVTPSTTSSGIILGTMVVAQG